MRIAYFTDTYLPQINGVTNTLDKLKLYLAKKNISHMFFAPEYPGTENSTEPNTKRFKSISFPVYPECRLSIPLSSNLYRMADSFNPDLVHLVTPLGIGLMGLKYAHDRKIPVVSSFHTNFDAYLKYYKLEYFEEAVWNFFRWFHSFSGINFCPSADTLKTLQSKGIGNLKIWSRGIDTNKFNPEHREKEIRHRLNAGDKIIFLYVGRLAAEKDLDILLESVKRVNLIYPGKAQFVFTGDGPYAEEMKRVSPDNVFYPGYLKGQELWTMYASCDAFVFPSSTETFGNVVLEAMASGLPVIAVNSGGVTDSIIHRYNGLLCEPRNIESFTNAIATFINDSSLVKNLGTNARRYSLTKSWDRIFEGLVNDYHSVVEEMHNNLDKSA